ncbi:dihydroorotase [Terasakiella sp. A23]|uniref:dihydroorotase n=1 Tax=Terasakiella sp. FCG-A23 TaxID=3080561 RepID=UPI0029557870|nr:dihydroorotase [Terasakiella sp. A23]MDV7341672.1 dihydroorotase [Terasakiella sp. A23]
MSLKPQGRVAYVNARLLDPATGLDVMGGVLTEGEKITDFGPGYAKATGEYGDVSVVDCEGACLCPGLVDIRVQLREPGEEHKGTLKTAGEAATSGGITSMVSLPNTNPVTDDMSVVEFVARRARLLGLSKVYPYGAITKGLQGKDMAEMGMLKESGAVAFTDGIRAVASPKVMRKALSYARNYDLLLVQHPEEPSLAEGGHMNAGDLALRMGLTGIPAVAETIMVARDVRLAEDTGGRLHFAHISTAESIDIIRRAKERGVRVTCDTAPPYFSLNELAVGEYRTFAKLSPPLRSEEDRQAIIEGIKDGVIDVVASDHAPEDEDSKRLPFAQAAFGGVGLETLLAITLELYHNGHMSLLDSLKTLTCNPADIIGLPAGKLEKGASADLCIFDPDRGWKIDADQLSSKSKNSPFDGRLAQGRCLRTVVDGRTVFEL